MRVACVGWPRPRAEPKGTNDCFGQTVLVVAVTAEEKPRGLPFGAQGGYPEFRQLFAAAQRHSQRMAEAARRAEADAGRGILSQADYIAITPQISFRELDERVLLPEVLGLAGVALASARSDCGAICIRCPCSSASWGRN